MTVGRLKVLAGGVEYRRAEFCGALRRAVRDAAAPAGGRPAVGTQWRCRTRLRPGLVRDPIRTEGAALRYTNPSDYRMKAAQSLLATVERMARHHGALLDTVRKAGLDGDEYQVTRLI